MSDGSETCSACGREVCLPEVGEVWSNVSTGREYVIETAPTSNGNYWGARIAEFDPTKYYGCDPSVQNAVWLSAVRDGRWRFLRSAK